MFPGNRTTVCVYTKNIRDWDITEEKGFPSGNGGFRDLVLAACCERLLPSANLREFELLSKLEYSQGDIKIVKGCLYFLIVLIAFYLLSLG